MIRFLAVGGYLQIERLRRNISQEMWQKKDDIGF
jgi:hypothetical protein